MACMACMAGDMACPAGNIHTCRLPAHSHQPAPMLLQGLGLDSCTCGVLELWGLGPQLEQNSVPMEIEENRIMTNRAATVVLRDQQRRNRR